MREKIAELIEPITARGLDKYHRLHKADTILSLIATEVERMENPYTKNLEKIKRMPQDDRPSKFILEGQELAWDKHRQAIIKKLKGE